MSYLSIFDAAMIPRSDCLDLQEIRRCQIQGAETVGTHVKPLQDLIGFWGTTTSPTDRHRKELALAFEKSKYDWQVGMAVSLASFQESHISAIIMN